MDVLKELLDNARRLLGEMTSTQRASVMTMIITVSSLLILIVWLGSMGDKSLKVPLNIKITLQQSEEFRQKLIAKGIAAEYLHEEQMMVVPEDQKFQALIVLAKENLLPEDGGETFEKALEKVKFTDTSTITAQRLKLALEDEVAAMIKSMNGIKNATVIYQGGSRKALFRHPTIQRASVRIDTDLGKKLTQPQADSIIRLVAYARSGLSPKNVNVTDQNLRHFTLEDSDSLGGMALKAMEMGLKTSERVQRQVEACIRRYIPKCEASAWVNTNYDMTKRRSQKHIVNEGKAKKTVQRKIEDNSSDVPGSTVGTQPNIRRSTNMDTGGGGRKIMRNYKRSDKDVLMELGYEDLHTEYAPVIKSQTISVVIDLPPVPVLDAKGMPVFEKDADGKDVINPNTGKPLIKQKSYTVLEGEELLALERSVAKVAGMIEGQEGMEIAIKQVPWSPNLEPDPRKIKRDAIKEFLTEHVVSLILMCILLMAVYFIYLQAKRSVPAEEVELPDLDAFGSAFSSGPLTEDDKNQADFEQLRDQVGDFIEEDPSKAASIIRRWMNSREGF